MRLRRSFLYMPGDDWRKIQKAAEELQPDSICMDLEDGVALNQKAAARSTIQKALQTLDFGRSERLVRINPLDTKAAWEDLQAVMPFHPDGIVVPKIAHPDRIVKLDRDIAALEDQEGVALGQTLLILIVETALGIVNLAGLVTASDRIAALVFGAEDFAGDVGATRSAAGMEMLYARSKALTFAKAFEKQAIDIVFPDFKNPDGFSAQAREGVEMGFDGKQLIHPSQIDLIHQVYTPDQTSIDAAARIVQAYQKHQTQGTGAFSLDGKMVDRPVVRQAEAVLERARAAGIQLE